MNRWTVGQPHNRIQLDNKKKPNAEITKKKKKKNAWGIKCIILNEGRQNQMAVRINLYDILEKVKL